MLPPKEKMSRKHWKEALSGVLVAAVLLTGCDALEPFSLPGEQSQSEAVIGSESLTQARTDYGDETNWIQIPEPLREADTFYINGTTYLTTDPGDPVYSGIADQNTRKLEIKKLEQNKGIYEEATNVFSPFYSQASVYSLSELNAEEAGELLMGEPVQDIYAALDYYFENYNEGRPFILAGYSQGAMLIRIILKDYMQYHPEYYERMIAAYVLGYSITKEDLKECPYLKFAEGAADTGVIVSFNTEGEGNGESLLVLDGAVSINPINWKRDDTYASASENLGSKITDPAGKEEIVSPGLADARVDTKRGVVICTGTDFPYIDTINGLGLSRQVFGEKSFHGNDCFLYYENLKENVGVRTESYLRKTKEKNAAM